MGSKNIKVCYGPKKMVSSKTSILSIGYNFLSSNISMLTTIARASMTTDSRNMHYYISVKQCMSVKHHSSKGRRIATKSYYNYVKGWYVTTIHAKKRLKAVLREYKPRVLLRLTLLHLATKPTPQQPDLKKMHRLSRNLKMDKMWEKRKKLSVSRK